MRMRNTVRGPRTGWSVIGRGDGCEAGNAVCARRARGGGADESVGAIVTAVGRRLWDVREARLVRCIKEASTTDRCVRRSTWEEDQTSRTGYGTRDGEGRG